MTIVTFVKVRDGLVLGTDSMTHVFGAGGFEKAYANARKLFQFADLPVGVMTHGAGNIGNRSIEGIVKDYARNNLSSRSVPGADLDVRSLASGLYQHIRALYDMQFSATQQPSLGFVIAGYSPGAAMADDFEFVLPQDSAPRPINLRENVGVSWRGIDVPFTALARGMNSGIYQELVKRGVPTADLEALAAVYGMHVSLQGMPLQDAVNFAAYILDTTIGWASFEIGVASCARPLQMAVIRPITGWEWLAQPQLALPAYERGNQ